MSSYFIISRKQNLAKVIYCWRRLFSAQIGFTYPRNLKLHFGNLIIIDCHFQSLIDVQVRDFLLKIRYDDKGNILENCLLKQ